MPPTVVFYHLETSGLDPGTDRPTAIAAAAFDAAAVHDAGAAPLDTFDAPSLYLPPWDLPHPGALAVNRRPIASYRRQTDPAPGTALRGFRDWLRHLPAPPVMAGWNSRTFTDPFLDWEAFRSFVPGAPPRRHARLDLSYLAQLCRLVHGADACRLPLASRRDGKPDNSLHGIAGAAGIEVSRDGSPLHQALHRMRAIAAHLARVCPRAWRHALDVARPERRDAWLDTHAGGFLRLHLAYGRAHVRHVALAGWSADPAAPPGHRGRPLLLNLQIDPAAALEMNRNPIAAMPVGNVYPFPASAAAPGGQLHAHDAITAPGAVSPEARRLLADAARLDTYVVRWRQEAQTPAPDLPPPLDAAARRVFAAADPQAALADDTLRPYALLTLREQEACRPDRTTPLLREADRRDVDDRLTAELAAPPAPNNRPAPAKRRSLAAAQHALQAERPRWSSSPDVMQILDGYAAELDALRQQVVL